MAGMKIGAVSCLLLLLAGCRAGFEARWRDLQIEIGRRFPEVPQLDIDAYAARAATAEPPLLVDVRPVAEHAVSWIPRAVHKPAGEGFVDAFAGVPKDRDIVLYCSVGWRSSAAARELLAAGYTRVANLEGSIFAWANAGRPLVNAAGPTALVHPYDREWGRLLDAAHRAPLEK